MVFVGVVSPSAASTQVVPNGGKGRTIPLSGHVRAGLSLQAACSLHPAPVVAGDSRKWDCPSLFPYPLVTSGMAAEGEPVVTRIPIVV